MTEKTRIERETGGVFAPLSAGERDTIVRNFATRLRHSGMVVETKVQADVEDVQNALRALLADYVDPEART